MRKDGKRAITSWESVVALCCFGGGIFAALLGSILTAISWFIGIAAHPWLRASGTALLILTIPLLILAGYCMDWDERKPTKRSVSSLSDPAEPS